jgi:hypothetical protein
MKKSFEMCYCVSTGMGYFFILEAVWEISNKQPSHF